MSTLKIGFHGGPGGNHTGIGDYYAGLDSAGIPFVIKSVDHYGHIFEAESYTNADHVRVFRLSTTGQNDGYDYDVPPYKDPTYANDPIGAAELHWQKTLEALPPEFNKDKVWLEVINEVDKNFANWLGEFAIHISQLAVAQGYKISLFGWSSGEPEVAHWEEPMMLAFLQYAAANTDKVAIALHEYSYTTDNIYNSYPYLVGRYQFLHDVCDAHGIGRPSIIMTEWGWEYNAVPGVELAIADIDSVAREYALHANILGAAIWYLGEWSGNIANETQALIAPVKELALNTTYPDPIPPPVISPPGGTMNIVIDQQHLAAMRGFGGLTTKFLRFSVIHNDGTANVNTGWVDIDISNFLELDIRGFEFHAQLEQEIEVDCDTTPPVDPPALEIIDIVGDLPLHPNKSYETRPNGEDDITVITTHHTVSGSDFASIEAIANFHINTNDWPGIAYHYCITNDGSVYQTNRLVTKSFHSGGNNHYSIGIALLGDFTNFPPSDDQLDSRDALVDYLITARLSKVDYSWGHRDMPAAQTECPGNAYLLIPAAFLPRPSEKFIEGDLVEVTSNSALNLRSTPFGAIVQAYPTGTQMTVVGANPVRATGFVWWHVSVNSNEGWVAEDYIEKVGSTQPPPSGDLVDIAAYFVPSGQYGHKIVMKSGAGTQPIQLEKRGSDVILRKGDGNWIDDIRYQDSEQWRVVDGEVQKGIDTSDAGNGGKDGYDLGWAKWIPQLVEIGQTYHSTPVVKRFDRTNNCQVYTESQADDYLTVKEIIPTWTSPANSAIVLNDVLVVEWRSATSDLSVPPNETYYFAKEYGYVGWNNDFILEITQGQSPLSGVLDCGM